jgi:hypothetical protein
MRDAHEGIAGGSAETSASVGALLRILADECVADQSALAIASWVAFVPLLVRTVPPPNR